MVRKPKDRFTLALQFSAKLNMFVTLSNSGEI